MTEFIANNPARFLRLFALKIAPLFNTFTPTHESNVHTVWLLRIGVALYFYLVLARAIVGVILTAREWRHYAPLVLLAVAWAAGPRHARVSACRSIRSSSCSPRPRS